jgi:rhodanese-related sulfurtransferase
MTAAIDYSRVDGALRSETPPLLIDVRHRDAFESAADMACGALRRDPESVSTWAKALPAASTVVVYCIHGHQVSQGVAQALRAQGIDCYYLEGGLEDGWRAHAAPLDRKPVNAATRWVTRERPKIDRIACPWLISRFVDADAEFLYVPTPSVRQTADATGAVPYDVPGVAFTHDGPLCSFDIFLRHYRLTDPALRQLAQIVRGADTGELALAPQAPGLLAVSLGLSRLFSDDHEMLDHGMVLYDALYAWCREGQAETHTWNPVAYSA